MKSYIPIPQHKQKNTKFSYNNHAVLGMPMYLTVAFIVTAVVLATFTVGIYTMISDSQAHHIEHELSRIVSEAQNMYQYADSGTMITISVQFPSSLSFIVFGSMPEPGYKKPIDRSLIENTSNIYYYVFSDGTMKMFHSPVQFSSENTDEFAVFVSGSYELCLELQKIGAKSYVSIYAK
jgi:hypothetical protein